MNSAILLNNIKIIYNVPIFIQIVLWCKMRAVPKMLELTAIQQLDHKVLTNSLKMQDGCH